LILFFLTVLIKETVAKMRRTLGQALKGCTTPLTREYLHILGRPGFDNPHGAAKGQALTAIAVTGVSFVLTHLLIIYLFRLVGDLAAGEERQRHFVGTVGRCKITSSSTLQWMGCSLLCIKVVSVQLALFIPYWRMCRRFSLAYHLLPFPLTSPYIKTAVG
jgi:hypothetical protein